MDSILKTLLKAAIEGKKDTAFQDIIDSIYSLKYGHCFTPVKQKRDKGCDGIVENKRVLSVYAPERQNLTEFKKKSKNDFEKYRENWILTHPDWEYVYNGEFTALMVQHLDSLKHGCLKTDINALLNMIGELPNSKRRDLAIEMGINEQFIINDVLKKVVEDLFKIADQSLERMPSHRPPPYIEDKIRLNYSETDVDDALKMYELVYPYFGDLRDVLKAYRDYEVGALKTRLTDCYARLSGGFKHRFVVLVEQFSEQNKDDDYYVLFVKVVLVYFFEICVIGERPGSEK